MNFPGYLGPGNKLKIGIPVDTDDEIAQVHDNEYHIAQSKIDIWNADRKAIRSFYNDARSNLNWHSAIGAAGLGIKHLAEKATNSVIYPRSFAGNE